MFRGRRGVWARAVHNAYPALGPTGRMPERQFRSCGVSFIGVSFHFHLFPFSKGASSMSSRFIPTPVTFVAIVLLAGIAAQTRAPAPVASRQFEFTYKVTVPALPAGSAPLHLWIPLPPSDHYQTISDLKIDGPVAYRIRTEREYGNRFAYFVVPPERAAAPFDITLRFQATRREHQVALADAHALALAPARLTPEIKRSLAPDHMVPLGGVIAHLPRQQTRGITDPLQRARKAYDYVVATMKYDKTGQGWGRGDAVWACDSKRGNCTDFHSVLIGMMRTKGIPARFEIGFPLPDDRSGGEITGYHCWAEFYIEGIGWV